MLLIAVNKYAHEIKLFVLCPFVPKVVFMVMFDDGWVH
jgi:hypothetical protein